MRVALGAAVLGILEACLVTLHVMAQPPAPGMPELATGTITVMVNGVAIATGGVLNLKSGAGVIVSASPDPAINGTDVTFDADSGYMQTLQGAQSGACCTLLALSTDGGKTYNASLRPVLASYSSGQAFSMLPIGPDGKSLPNIAGATLNIGMLGPIAISGTCSVSCVVIYTPGSPAVWTVH